MKKEKRLWLIIPLFLTGSLSLACDKSLKTVHYPLKTHKVRKPIRLVLLTDLHSCYYGKDQQDLIKAIRMQAPNLIVMTGDMVDDKISPDNTNKLLAAIGKTYPCYYVSGNHEYGSGKIDQIKKIFRESGVTVLEGDTHEFNLNGQGIMLSGVDDPYKNLSKTLEQLKTCGEQIQPEKYHILLAHRPEMIKTYLENDFDLILCGHAHGGQWRLPGLINGLYAPGQGLFPKYAGGQYTFGEINLIVSRGLARESTKVPRIFNRPELVVIDIESKPL